MSKTNYRPFPTIRKDESIKCSYDSAKQINEQCQKTGELLEEVTKENERLRVWVRASLERRNEDLGYHGGQSLDVEKTLERIVRGE